MQVQPAMSFLVSNAAKECGVSNPVVCIIHHVKYTNDSSVYNEKIEEVMKNISSIKEKTLPTQEVRGFRELYKSIGSKVTPAGENLLHNCFKKQTFPRYSNLVDAYNIVALENVSPFGMHDASDLINSKGPLIFKRAIGEEIIVPAFKNETHSIPKGDFTYGIKKDGSFIPFAWLGKKDVDSKHYQLNEKTTAILFTAIGNQYTSLERNKQLCEQVFKEILKSCPEAKMEILEPTFVEDIV